jgi:ABC-type amino acid transport system permease subunit
MDATRPVAVVTPDIHFWIGLAVGVALGIVLGLIIGFIVRGRHSNAEAVFKQLRATQLVVFGLFVLYVFPPQFGFGPQPNVIIASALLTLGSGESVGTYLREYLDRKSDAK